MEWSTYQNKIFEFVQSGSGSAVVNAVAGSGKTTTIVEAANRLPKNNKVLFLAFNKAIVEELKERFKSSNISCKTMHAYGYSTLLKSKMANNTTKINENKWRVYFTKNLCNLAGIKRNTKGYGRIVNQCVELFDMCRINCVKGGDIDSVKAIERKYSMAVEDYVPGVVTEVLKIAYIIKPGNDIDFVDMICLPVMNATVNKFCQKYDFVFVDEAQDLSLAQQELLKLTIANGGRFVAVGDPKQAINGFAGALSDSFDRLKELSGGVEFPLSVNYRCPKNLIDMVKEIVPSIEAHDNAIVGNIETKKSLVDVSYGDMVLCRKTSPLIVVALKMASKGKKAYIKGKDIGESLAKIIRPAIESGDDFSVCSSMLEKERKTIDDKIAKGLLSPIAKHMHDEKIECIKIVHEAVGRPSEMLKIIENLFEDKIGTDSVRLSTVHRAKGLESDNVYILCPNLLPMLYDGQSDWEMEQENNLRYVALTRAKKNLYLVDVMQTEVSDLEV